jgi:hypothetical protein
MKERRIAPRTPFTTEFRGGTRAVQERLCNLFTGVKRHGTPLVALTRPSRCWPEGWWPHPPRPGRNNLRRARSVYELARVCNRHQRTSSPIWPGPAATAPV